MKQQFYINRTEYNHTIYSLHYNVNAIRILLFPRQYFHTSHFLICSLNMTSQILDAIFYVKKLPKESKIPILFIFSSSLKPQAWLFLHLCLLCPSMWWKTETFTSPHFVLSLFFHYSKVWFFNCLHFYFFLCKGIRKKATSSPRCSWPWHHDDPWLPEGEILESLLSVRGLEALRQLVCSSKVPTKICNIIFQQRIIQLNFFKMLWKACSRDHHYLTKFDLLLQILKQNQRLNNWIAKLFSLFPSQIDLVLTYIFKKYSVHERPRTKNFSMEEW